MTRMHVERIGPVITPASFGLRDRATIGKNINGPSLMRVPAWVENPAGKYYLYFGHHKGSYIRLATAEHPEGPYTLYAPGVLHGKDTFVGRDRHLASPDIIVHDEARRIDMYFHANIKGTGAFADQGQTTYRAESSDGLHFTADPTMLGPFYFRVFSHDGAWYAIAKNDNLDGMLLRSSDGRSEFERGPTFVPGFRHCAVLKRGNDLHVFYTRAFEKQESIMHAVMRLDGDWKTWTLAEPRLLLKPEHEWEGASLRMKRSSYGSTGKANALRDPCIYEEAGKVYLLYSFKGENGIAIARIHGV